MHTTRYRLARILLVAGEASGWVCSATFLVRWVAALNARAPVTPPAFLFALLASSLIGIAMLRVCHAILDIADHQLSDRSNAKPKESSQPDVSPRPAPVQSARLDRDWATGDRIEYRGETIVGMVNRVVCDERFFDSVADAKAHVDSLKQDQ